MLRSRLDRIRALRATIAADPRDLDARRRLVEQYLDNQHGDPDVRRWTALALAELHRILALQRSTPGTGELDLLRTRSAILAVRDDVTPAEWVADAEETLATRERVLGPLHRDTLDAVSRLSALTPEPGRSELRDRCVSGLEALLAAEPDALWVRLRLGHMYEKDHPARAREHRRLAIAGWERIAAERDSRLGPVDPSTVDARQFRADLAEAFGGQEGERVREAERILADHVRLLGTDHPATTRARVEVVRARGHGDPAGVALAEEWIGPAFAAPSPDFEAVRWLRHTILVHYSLTGRGDEIGAIAARYPLPAEDDLQPGDPGYPETDDDI
ncbi:hypothetical protein Acy02nite_06000 [Actinoplanes cyaneus]|uniref:Tetratricopeptide repeat protein n=1 Tax=Actinoplanes cyaneus TaxID=52696 RepID=A0A919M4V8_9ACTN|nr:hypothetical protein [Actinoplanes cyaneus]MCW2135916.1 hypothetical protein [Actinoplanes cyaneus]GID62719.1 hypothetical protein Acy02nite_06000 [Actinoplanes cyaneus]